MEDADATWAREEREIRAAQLARDAAYVEEAAPEEEEHVPSHLKGSFYEKQIRREERRRRERERESRRRGVRTGGSAGREGAEQKVRKRVNEWGDEIFDEQ